MTSSSEPTAHSPQPTASPAEAVLACTGLVKHFQQADTRVDVLKGVELSVMPGERLAIVGVSGSGKTTLLQLLGGLDLPTAGSVTIAGQRISELSDTARGTLRNRALGFVYQFHHLLPEFSALENVAMPLLIRRTPPGEARRLARAAVARALVTQPAVVLADEPTGNLDGANARQVFELMLELNREFGTALVIVTHATELAAKMQRTLTLTDGRLV